MNINNITFPKNKKNIHIISIALHANGTSSYRDSTAIAKLCSSIWTNSNIYILTDNPSNIKINGNNIYIVHISSKQQLLIQINSIVSQINDKENLLFTMSSHGYSTSINSRINKELNGRSEYVMISNKTVMDYELFESLYDSMKPNVFSLCLIDTCHSGTMLDLEYLSYDGLTFHQTYTISKKRPLSFCISACNDNEKAGEDISNYAGWGGKLTCHFLDYISKKSSKIFNIFDFYKSIHKTFTSQSYQKSHPIISYND